MAASKVDSFSGLAGETNFSTAPAAQMDGKQWPLECRGAAGEQWQVAASGIVGLSACCRAHFAARPLVAGPVDLRASSAVRRLVEEESKASRSNQWVFALGFDLA